MGCLAFARNALIGGALRKMSSKSEHEPTSDRSRGYGSVHPIRVSLTSETRLAAAYLAEQRMTSFLLPSAHWSPANRAGVQADRRNVVSSKHKTVSILFRPTSGRHKSLGVLRGRRLLVRTLL